MDWRQQQFVVAKVCIVLLVSLGTVWYSIKTTNSALQEQQQFENDLQKTMQQSMRLAERFQAVEFQQLIEGEGSAANDGSVSTSDLTNQVVESVEEILRTAPVYDELNLDPVELDKMLSLASEFVYYRFIRADAEDYLAWRLSQGDRFCDPDRLYNQLQVAIDHEDLFGEPFPSQPSPRELFIRFFNEQESRWGDQYVPVGLAIDPESMLVATYTYNPIVGGNTVEFTDPQMERYWLDTRTVSHRSWFTNTPNFDAMRDELKSYQTATIGLTLLFRNGERRTMYLTVRRAGKNMEWKLGSLATADYERTGGMIEY